MSLIIIFLIPSVLLLFSPQTNATSSSILINKVCTAQNFDTAACIRLLKSEPVVVHATNMYDLSVGIINSGISNSTNTRTYIENLLKTRSTVPKLQLGALKECNSSYYGIIGDMMSALKEVEMRDCVAASYDLYLAAFDEIRICLNAVASNGVNDTVILKGNDVVQLYVFSANQAVTSIEHCM